ncbi:putative berberine bridge enzyme [Purpureocillium lilacinum]|uniref:Putative berberine bridge enzyme n=1 Tax=Purpureocillium lilacinum TaxID=33203 RepID=A0A2U3E6Q0_PURLI|nr:putative berberine bridge enzyme [Purpureocillium lilacinum]
MWLSTMNGSASRRSDPVSRKIVCDGHASAHEVRTDNEAARDVPSRTAVNKERKQGSGPPGAMQRGFHAAHKPNEMVPQDGPLGRTAQLFRLAPACQSEPTRAPGQPSDLRLRQIPLATEQAARTLARMRPARFTFPYGRAAEDDCYLKKEDEGHDQSHPTSVLVGVPPFTRRCAAAETFKDTRARAPGTQPTDTTSTGASPSWTLSPLLSLSATDDSVPSKMGNGQSTPLQQCLNTVCNGRLGCVAFPSDALYQAAWVKPYNLDVPVTPIAVFKPSSTEDVAGAIKCAVASNVHVQAKSGGHSYANFGLGGQDGELMIDLANLQDFHMDKTSWQATFGAGYRLGDLDKKLQANGNRAIAHGTCPGVGIGGHATIGGLGPMSRMWGSALDHVLSVQVVTADGSIKNASESENSDLFWALRGAGASFGVITKFTVKTHPAPGSVVQYTYKISLGSQAQMAPVYAAWQALAGDPKLDRRFSTLFIAEPLGALITGTFYGTKAEYEATGIAARLPSGGTLDLKLLDWLGSLAHIAEVVGLTLGDIPTSFYGKSLALREEDMLDRTSIDGLFRYMGDADAGTLLWFVIFNSEGGAMADTPAGATAYPHRDKLIMYQSYVIGIPTLTKATRDFADGVHDRVRMGAPSANSTYAGYIDRTLSREAAQEFYWGAQLPRLREVKKAWDPKDVFHNPQSVDPAE